MKFNCVYDGSSSIVCMMGVECVNVCVFREEKSSLYE